MKIDYEDIPQDQISSLRKDVFRRDKKIRMWSALSGGVAVLLASSISKAVFPQKQDAIGSIVLGVILAASLGALLWKAVVDPQIRRGVERRMGQPGREN